MLINYKNVKVWQDEKLVLDNVSFTLDEGEFVYITGKVGSGKSSFLKTLYGELPVNGNRNQRLSHEAETTAEVLGTDMLALTQKHMPELRRKMGVIFQDFQLLPDRSVRQNLQFVLRATGWKKKSEIEKRIMDVMTLVGLEHKAENTPNELSGGEQQRAAIARAILNRPQLILADEPTGNLDTETSDQITELLQNLSKAGSAVVMITHNLSLIDKYPGRVLQCKDGTISENNNI